MNPRELILSCHGQSSLIKSARATADWSAIRGLRPQGVDSGRVTGHPEVVTDGRGGATMILPGETEAGSSGTQPCRGITWWADRDDRW